MIRTYIRTEPSRTEPLPQARPGFPCAKAPPAVASQIVLRPALPSRSNGVRMRGNGDDVSDRRASLAPVLAEAARHGRAGRAARPRAHHRGGVPCRHCEDICPEFSIYIEEVKR